MRYMMAVGKRRGRICNVTESTQLTSYPEKRTVRFSFSNVNERCLVTFGAGRPGEALLLEGWVLVGNGRVPARPTKGTTDATAAAVLGLRRCWLFSRFCPGSWLFCGGAADPGVGRPVSGIISLNRIRAQVADAR
jgi:hypothetical protein